MIKPDAARAAARLALNAAVLVFATLGVMSWLSGRWALALLWSGSLIVAFAELHGTKERGTDSPAMQRRLDWLRVVGLVGATVGAILVTTSSGL